MIFVITSGSDGLIKLWNIKSSECVKTLDAHEDKVWALDVSRDEETLVSGAGDAAVILWQVRAIPHTFISLLFMTGRCYKYNLTEFLCYVY